MKYLLKRYLIIAIAVYLVTQIIGGFFIENSWKGFFYSALILTILMYIAKPIVDLFLLPINLLSLNLASWLMNILTIYIWTLLATDITISSWQFEGFKFSLFSLSPFYFLRWQMIILVGIVLTIVIQVLNWVLK